MAKHTSINNNLYKTLINAELWFSAPTSFNDPFDCQINDQTKWTDNLIREYVTKTSTQNGENINVEDVVKANQQKPGSFAKLFTEHLIKRLTKIGVTCFMPRPDNLLMWAHYSDSHKGVCLKFDIEEDPKLFKHTYKVIYTGDYPEFDYLKERDQLVNKVVRTKSKEWAYEEEVRTIQESSGLQPFNRTALKEIIFGTKADPNEIKTIRQIVEGIYPNLKLKQVKLKNNSFQIDIVDI